MHRGKQHEANLCGTVSNMQHICFVNYEVHYKIPINFISTMCPDSYSWRSETYNVKFWNCLIRELYPILAKTFTRVFYIRLEDDLIMYTNHAYVLLITQTIILQTVHRWSKVHIQTLFYCFYCFYFVTSLIKIFTTDITLLYILTVYILF
jgi:hypothetical protein